MRPAPRLQIQRYLHSVLACLILAWIAVPAWADPWPNPVEGSQHEASPDQGDPRVVTTVLIDAESVAPGDTVRVGVHFAMDPHWHIYWRNPGQGAYESQVTWNGPGTFGEMQWPAPSVFVTSDGFITTYGYEDEVILWHDWTVPMDAAGTVTLSATADFLTCEVDCIPGLTTGELQVPVDSETTPPGQRVGDAFDVAAANTPVSLDSLGWSSEFVLEQSAVRPGDTTSGVLGVIGCAIPANDCLEVDPATAQFVPDRARQLTFDIGEGRSHPSAFSGAAIDIGVRAGIDAVDADQVLSGVLSISSSDGVEHHVEIHEVIARQPADADVTTVEHLLLVDALDVEFDGDAPALALAADATTPAATAPDMPLWRVLLLAFVGGILLNLMPCVLPVLGLKVTSFVELVHNHQGRVGSHAAAYAGGIVGSMMVLASAVLALRAAGTAVGWGFQFQHPQFVAVVAAVVVLFACNLFGAWDLRVSATGLDAAKGEAPGLARSGLEGVLTVILATPCTAPFLGTAVGFALAANAPTVLLTFLMLGLGLAAPFVLLVLIPGTARVLPRPGNWMNVLKQVLGFTMLAALAWLIWLFGRIAGGDALGPMLFWLVFVAFAAWVFGELQRRDISPAVAAVLCMGGVVGGGFWALGNIDVERSNTHMVEGWHEWSGDAVAETLRNDRIAFVDFTADWCITCKMNERNVLADDRVMAAAAEYGVDLYIADWTVRDDTIRDELARYGRAGVPMYLVYSPARPDQAEVLPELLSVDRVLEAFAAAASPATATTP